MSIRSPRRRWVAGAAACWTVGGIGYLAGEAVAAAAFQPAYSYARNYISDLGRPSISDLAIVMNAAFCVQGSAFLLGAGSVVHTHGSPRSRPFLAFAAANAVGNIVVATVHHGPVHVTGAVLAIVGGNAAILAGYPIVQGSRGYRGASIAFATTGLAAFGLLAADAARLLTGIVPAAVYERAAVYAIVAWQLLSAITLIRGSAASRRR